MTLTFACAQFQLQSYCRINRSSLLVILFQLLDINLTFSRRLRTCGRESDLVILLLLNREARVTSKAPNSIRFLMLHVVISRIRQNLIRTSASDIRVREQGVFQLIGVSQRFVLNIASMVAIIMVTVTCAKDQVTPPAATTTDFKLVDHGQTTSSINGIWGISDINMFFVGANGTILKNEISGFTEITSGTTNSLLSVFGADGANIYATGFLGTVLRFDGAGWSLLAPASGTTLQINDVWVAGTTVYMVDPSNIRSIEVGGTSMRVDTAPTPPFNAVFANDNDAFIVGGAGRIFRYRPGSFNGMNSTTSEDLNDIWGQGTFMVAVGGNGTVVIGDGTSWTVSTEGQFPTLNAVWGFSSSDVYAVGNGGTVIHFNGTSWSSLSTPTSLDLQAVFGANANSIHASGPNGLVIHFTD